ncbi:DUF4222 domain-containing protein [Yersinia ruckeri]|nr:DUF4222 domain-containing protein [Yersinia ruckeri]AKA37726.1 hypothetical protein UGYR_04500 [Yersinia ruckeri]ARZ01341.1 hypothetical protein QMA0440_02008 [Yersinia ruckeri]AUQ42552.1 DUF4222 domain-containing protein [Yersinia ruckeri]EKN4181939.1 DUF4222 domain-containing protein [Yersinia ruckeri]EKN4197667.1 DUF4222 domain-containing protein [Yersinia ruckeri]
MTEQFEELDRHYVDKRGVRVHVIRFNRLSRQVIYRRAGYEHELCKPLARFRKEFKQVGV